MHFGRKREKETGDDKTIVGNTRIHKFGGDYTIPGTNANCSLSTDKSSHYNHVRQIYNVFCISHDIMFTQKADRKPTNFSRGMNVVGSTTERFIS